MRLQQVSAEVSDACTATHLQAFFSRGALSSRVTLEEENMHKVDLALLQIHYYKRRFISFFF